MGAFKHSYKPEVTELSNI